MTVFKLSGLGGNSAQHSIAADCLGLSLGS